MPDNAPKIEMLPTASIIPYQKNARKNDAAVRPLSECIRQFGFTSPIIVNADRVIIAGHTRLRAAQELGLESVPCIVKRDLTPDQEKALRLADNRVSEFSRWDADLLRQEMDELAAAGLDLSGVGLGEYDVSRICGALAPAEVAVRTDEELDDAPDPDKSAPPDSRRGAIYALGRHRLMCGDATSPADMDALTCGREMDLWLTDPPYNVDYGSARADRRQGIMNDAQDAAAFDLFLRAAFPVALAALRPGGSFYVWHAFRTQAAFEAALNASGATVREQLVWAKDSLVLGRQDYQWRHEPCFYGWKEGGRHVWMSDRRQTTVLDIAPKNATFDGDRVVIPVGRGFFSVKADAAAEEIPASILEFPRPKASKEHPTMKPVALFKYLMKNSSETGDSVLDSFAGSGTAAIAAEACGRTAYLMEIDPVFADVIRKRFAALSGAADRWRDACPEIASV